MNVSAQFGRIGLAMVAASALVAAASGEERHGNGQQITARDLNRSYGFTCLGQAPLPGPVAGAPVPFAQLGQVTCDGRDTCTGSGYVAQGPGEPVLTFVTGKYTVAPNGLGQVLYHVSFAPGAPPVFDLPIRFVVMDDGREVRGLPTLPGFAVICELKEQ